MPHLQVSILALDLDVSRVGRSAKPILSAVEDIRLTSIHVGTNEDTVLVQLDSGALCSDHNVRPEGESHYRSF